MYEEYLMEVYSITSVYTENYFYSYKILGDAVSLCGSFVRKERRGTRDILRIIQGWIKVGKENGCTKIIMTVTTVQNNWEVTLALWLKVGFEVVNAGNDFFSLEKRI